MKKLLVFLAMFTLLSASEKVALVIGNKNYSNQTGLKNPVRDAKLIRDTLNGMGFEVLEAYNKDLESLGNKLEAFVSKARSAKVAVVYYAGHGIGVGSRNYLIPLGATNLSKSNLARKLLSVDELKEAVANAKGFGVVLFDACRNSFFSGAISGLSSGRASRALVPPSVSRANVLVSFSTQAGTKAEDDVNGGDHSPYAIALSENLKNNRDIRLVMGSIRTRVYGLTSNQQYPIEKNMLDGEDYCLSGVCQEQKVKVVEKIVYRDRVVEPTPVVQAPVVVEEIRKVDNNLNIVTIGNLMYQNEPINDEEEKLYSSNKGTNFYIFRSHKGRVQDWEGAIKYCEELTLSKYSDWRLPTVKELDLSEVKSYMFKRQGEKEFWTLDEDYSNPFSAYIYRFSEMTSYANSTATAGTGYVLCVR